MVYQYRKPISDEVNDSDEEYKKSKTVSSCSSWDIMLHHSFGVYFQLLRFTEFIGMVLITAARDGEC